MVDQQQKLIEKKYNAIRQKYLVGEGRFRTLHFFSPDDLCFLLSEFQEAVASPAYYSMPSRNIAEAKAGSSLRYDLLSEFQEAGARPAYYSMPHAL